MSIVGGGIIEGLSTRLDGSVKVVIGTQEMEPEEAGRLFALRGKFIKYLLSSENVTQLEAEAVTSAPIVDDKKKKTPSQRLRACIFRLWEQENPPIAFDSFYNAHIELLIDSIKAQLK